jgi:tetratricopeptide (TPR) repeat protein
MTRTIIYKFKIMLRLTLGLLFVILSSNINAQQISEITSRQVFDQIINAIGNNNPRPPKLIFKDSERSPASYSPKKKTITIENKVLEICYSFGEDSLNALSYILAHELGHHYRNHGWMSQYASLEFSNTLDNQNKTPEQREGYEIESDIYAGFYAHIAGYDALKVADVFLDAIYKSYSLPDELKNYPTLDERKAIIDQNKSDFEELRDVFDLANIVMSVGQYDYAQELYQYIIDRGFTSREIYNNLGLCYVYEALAFDLEDTYFDLLMPFKIDLSTRLESNGASRGAITLQQQAIFLFNNAKREFETAIQLDDNYSIAQENLFFSDVALTYLGETVRSHITSDDLIAENKSCEFCVRGHSAVINKELSKAKKLFQRGSLKCAICDINTDFRKKQTPKTKKYQKTEFDLEEINGVDMYCKDFKSTQCDMYYQLNASKICIKVLDVVKVVMLKKKIQGNTSCVSIQEISTNDDKLKNNVQVYIGDHIDKILDNYQNLRIVNSANSKYISIADEQLTFLIEGNRVKKWYYFERLD